ncbi:ornithine cyclodeaminase family protein [Stratiformator vulcanicus]|uniref:L-lysine cyclodeaminase n=1 Tax=Stratiformator vulcanicus TaxID=2527980 RepID=A0A517QXG4_9PLAN|nr:ornithine cyclodeaminase family protein [Stratiformator vulcanicus]QDT36356.1 L-lysine cyclodeaminase [Stratiformator vulcanicus]
MSTLYLRENDVNELVSVGDAIDVLETAFRELAAGRADNVPRQRARSKGIRLHSMSAAAEYLGVSGWKQYTTTRSGAQFLVGLYDNASGRLTALIEADRLGQLRTGAASGVATEFMARPDATSVGLFGAGTQAATQLEAVCAVRKINRVSVYSRTASTRNAFAERMSEILNIAVEPVVRPDLAAMDHDIVITATTSASPLFDGRLLSDGVHLNLVGSNSLRRTEVDAATVERADILVCDSIEACRGEAGDFREALEAGAIEWSRMSELSDIITGNATGRARSEDITLFKSVGLAIEDVALAAEVLKRAEAQGRGTALPI